MNRSALCACGHPWLLHDIAEYDGDGTDLCCVLDCDQDGCPGRQMRAMEAA